MLKFPYVWALPSFCTKKKNPYAFVQKKQKPPNALEIEEDSGFNFLIPLSHNFVL